MIAPELAEQEDRYTQGDCWVLALALAKRLGWDVAITDLANHAFAISPDGEEAVDVYGFQPTRRLLKDWDATSFQRLESIAAARRYFNGDPQTHWGSWGGDRVQWKLAERVAELILKLDGSLYQQEVLA